MLLYTNPLARALFASQEVIAAACLIPLGLSCKRGQDYKNIYMHYPELC